MAVPDFQSFMLPVMKIMSDKQTHSVAELKDTAPRQMGISDEDKARVVAERHEDSL